MGSNDHYDMYDHEREYVKREQRGTIESPLPPKDKLRGGDVEMSSYLHDRSLSYTLAKTNNWYPSLFGGDLRIIIPCVSLIPHHRFWQGRLVRGEGIRYTSPKGPKRDALVIVDGGRATRSTLVITEGPTDALAWAEHQGVTGCALMGVFPTDEQIDHICKRHELHRYDHVIIGSDADRITEMAKVQNRLAVAGIGSTLIYPKTYKDFAEETYETRQRILTSYACGY